MDFLLYNNFPKKNVVKLCTLTLNINPNYIKHNGVYCEKGHKY